jgi:hypothetical protein
VLQFPHISSGNKNNFYLIRLLRKESNDSDDKALTIGLLHNKQDCYYCVVKFLFCWSKSGEGKEEEGSSLRRDVIGESKAGE